MDKAERGAFKMKGLRKCWYQDCLLPDRDPRNSTTMGGALLREQRALLFGVQERVETIMTDARMHRAIQESLARKRADAMKTTTGAAATVTSELAARSAATASLSAVGSPHGGGPPASSSLPRAAVVTSPDCPPWVDPARAILRVPRREVTVATLLHQEDPQYVDISPTRHRRQAVRDMEEAERLKQAGLYHGPTGAEAFGRRRRLSTIERPSEPSDIKQFRVLAQIKEEERLGLRGPSSLTREGMTLHPSGQTAAITSSHPTATSALSMAEVMLPRAIVTRMATSSVALTPTLTEATAKAWATVDRGRTYPFQRQIVERRLRDDAALLAAVKKAEVASPS